MSPIARNKLSAVAPSIAGTTIALTAATDLQGDAVRPNNKIWIQNGSLSSITVTLVTGGTAEGYAVADPTVTIAAGQGKLIGPFSDVFPQTSGADAGWVYIDYSAITSVTRAVIA